LDRGWSSREAAVSTGAGHHTKLLQYARDVGDRPIFDDLPLADAMDRDAAFDIAKWSGLGLIAGYGFVAARLTGDTVPGSLRRAAIAAVIAGFLIVIKALVH
jgi:hypothetical protein